MVRERTVEFREQVDERHRQAFEHDRQDQAAHAVRGVGDDRERTHRAGVDEREHVVRVGVEEPLLADAAGAAPVVTSVRSASADLEESRVLADRTAPGRQNFIPL